MSLRFGTSGVRGLVTDMTDRECYLYTKSFVQYLSEQTESRSIALAGDLRSSTPRIMKAVAYAIKEDGFEVDYCGHIATSIVADYAINRDMPSMMVTGSHIPDDRNGIKFNMPWGEILKKDERAISDNYTVLKSLEIEQAKSNASIFAKDGTFRSGIDSDVGDANSKAEEAYLRRFVDFYPAESLAGLRIVFYQHSSVSRDILPEVLRLLGADIISVGRSDVFVPVDTEAVAEPEKLANWVREYDAFALVSTDGDGDRPLVVDECGKVVRGDVLGILVSDFLNADAVCTPVSCNTALEKSGRFTHVSRTRIGSPYVIAAMNDAIEAGYKRVVGYEANGGFLTASDIMNPETDAILNALPTRDAALPIVAVLAAASSRGLRLSELVAELPPRFTVSGLLRPFPWELSDALLAKFQAGGKAFADETFSGAFGSTVVMDFTDGPRMTFASDDVVHLRPSGNAPEFRCYTESDTEEEAVRNNRIALQVVEQLKGELRSAVRD